ncbi:hypothetical protein ABZ738_30355 [Micromonospora sp. NPDC047793]|uniref:hypothetical protein n=1 Tax=Micromonospora sp. NPDC047793 TaxID=3154342 RepID=UPI0033F81D65
MFDRKHDHERSPGRDLSSAQAVAFVQATIPSIETGHYLLRRSQTARERTWSDVDGALGWLAETYAKHPPDRTLSYLPQEARLHHTRTGLMAGSDAVWHYTTSVGADRVIVYVVICCPHRHHTRTPCPLPPH